MEKRLLELLQTIEAPDSEAMQKARQHWNSIAKPLGSLGSLEDITTLLAGISSNEQFSIDKRALIIMCADNGVVCEGVTQTGQEVTAIVAENFLDEKSCVALMCKKSNTDIFPIDIGMVSDTPRVEKHKIAYGTKNIAKEAAMTRVQAIEAIMVGLDKVRELKEKGYNIIATGEMGIGNTTTSSAITSVLLNCPPEEVTGRGAGLSSDGLTRKISVITEAISLNKPDINDPIDILAKLGGFDIAGLTGVFLGGAIYKLPIIIDGFISEVAALLAVSIAPKSNPYIIASHVSREPAAQMILDALGKEAVIRCNMHLGEGSGAVALLPLLDFAQDIYYKMSSFDDINIEAYQELK